MSPALLAAAARVGQGQIVRQSTADEPPQLERNTRKAFVVLPKLSDPSAHACVEPALSRHFGQFGTVESCKVRLERGCCFVEWTTPEAAARALAVPKHVIDELPPPSGSYSFNVLVRPFQARQPSD